MAHQHVQCTPAVLATVSVMPAAVVPGVVCVQVESITVELRLRVTYTEPIWPAIESRAQQNLFAYLPDFRGPPALEIYYPSCRGARSCAPHLVSSSPWGAYAATY